MAVGRTCCGYYQDNHDSLFSYLLWFSTLVTNGFMLDINVLSLLTDGCYLLYIDKDCIVFLYKVDLVIL